ncbi:MAG: L,D-transpeptidase family protein [Chitinophagaceae bacterium]|nr:L,D-transpeptidase family protein [Chitinophagaceae bacterium]MCB9055706.1 L,D-transpeptidase family protein [Chitinophagales bacterium]
MLKKTILPFVLASVIISCNNSKEPTDDEANIENVDDPITKGKGKKVTDRDYSITEENAYNDLFLDSLAMERYISNRNLADKKISRRIRSFYNARNYQYAWFSSEGVTEQTRFFWNQYDYAVSYLKDTTLQNSDFYKSVENVVNRETLKVSKADSAVLNTEFALTEYFIRYINSTYEKGYVKRKEQEKFIPIKKQNPMVIADSLLTKKHKDDKYYEEVNSLYAGLKKSLQVYYNIAKAGGWPNIPSIKSSIKPGTEHEAIPLIRKRLTITGDMPAESDTTNMYTDTLVAGVKKFQKRYGYREDGIITAGLVKDMNVTVRERIMQILLNMDRMRWMPQQPDGYLIIVNIPEFMLHVYNKHEPVFDMVVVVGKVGHNTMMFNGDLQQIVFSPYWNVPASIIKNEIMPAIARNPNYLASKNMEKVGAGIRQKPGPGNALGKVKFIFPNSFNMYFHDTPSKSLFSRDKRAFSHGCIRLSEPQKMAEWLLRDDAGWNTDKVVAAMNKSYETPVKLKEPIPVFIIYYTAWVDHDGLLNFRDDVYDHDKQLIKKMFTPLPEPMKIIRVDNLNTNSDNN